MEHLAKWRALSAIERRLLVESMLALALARLAVALLPFRVIGHLASRRPAMTVSPQARCTATKRVRWAVGVCARRVPFRAKCFEQGLAALWMLRRRGVAATLHFGAAREHENLVAHVWITANDEAVIGCETSDQFFELVRFPGLAENEAWQ